MQRIKKKNQGYMSLRMTNNIYDKLKIEFQNMEKPKYIFQPWHLDHCQNQNTNSISTYKQTSKYYKIICQQNMNVQDYCVYKNNLLILTNQRYIKKYDLTNKSLNYIYLDSQYKKISFSNGRFILQNLKGLLILNQNFQILNYFRKREDLEIFQYMNIQLAYSFLTKTLYRIYFKEENFELEYLGIINLQKEIKFYNPLVFTLFENNHKVCIFDINKCKINSIRNYNKKMFSIEPQDCLIFYLGGESCCIYRTDLRTKSNEVCFGTTSINISNLSLVNYKELLFIKDQNQVSIVDLLTNKQLFIYSSEINEEICNSKMYKQNIVINTISKNKRKFKLLNYYRL